MPSKKKLVSKTKKNSRIKKRKKLTKKTKVVKKTKKTCKTKESKKTKQKEKLIGKVTHYFSHIGVAVIKLVLPLRVGDKIRVVGGSTNFSQAVKSMEVDHKKIKRAKKGEAIGLKMRQKVREGYKVYKLSS